MHYLMLFNLLKGKSLLCLLVQICIAIFRNFLKPFHYGKYMSKCRYEQRFLLSNYDTRDWNLDLINFVNYWKNWFHQKKTLEALKRKCFWKILLLELNNLPFEQFTIYSLNNLLLERFTVKCLNTLKIDTIIKLSQQIVWF